jgi:hypothetical protein
MPSANAKLLLLLSKLLATSHPFLENPPYEDRSSKMCHITHEFHACGHANRRQLLSVTRCALYLQAAQRAERAKAAQKARRERRREGVKGAKGEDGRKSDKSAKAVGEPAAQSAPSPRSDRAALGKKLFCPTAEEPLHIAVEIPGWCGPFCQNVWMGEYGEIWRRDEWDDRSRLRKSAGKESGWRGWSWVYGWEGGEIGAGLEERRVGCAGAEVGDVGETESYGDDGGAVRRGGYEGDRLEEETGEVHADLAERLGDHSFGEN